MTLCSLGPVNRSSGESPGLWSRRRCWEEESGVFRAQQIMGVVELDFQYGIESEVAVGFAMCPSTDDVES